MIDNHVLSIYTKAYRSDKVVSPVWGSIINTIKGNMYGRIFDLSEAISKSKPTG